MQSILSVLDDESNLKGFRESARNMFLLEELYTFKFQAFTYFLSDILSTVDNLCQHFQEEQLNVHQFYMYLDNFKFDLKENYIEKKIYGENFQDFMKLFMEE